MVARGRLLACKHHVAPDLRYRRNHTALAAWPRTGLDKSQRTGSRHRHRHVEAQRIGFARSQPCLALFDAERARIAGIDRRAVGMARPWRLRIPMRDKARDLAARFEARKDEPQGFEACKRRAVVVEMLTLPADRVPPRQPQTR